MSDLERIYDPHDCVLFRKTSEPFGGLSNMAPGFRVRLNGVLFLTVEALYQACRFPDDPDLQNFIISQKSPMTLKMRIKRYKDRSRPDWERVRVRLMRWCIRLKLSQNLRSFGDLLLKTEDLPIVESSRKDPFWGAIPSSSGHLVGANVLGRLLMELREDFRKASSNSPFEVSPPDVENLILLGKPVTLSRSSVTDVSGPLQSVSQWDACSDARVLTERFWMTSEKAKAVADLLRDIGNEKNGFEVKMELNSKGSCSKDDLDRIEAILHQAGIRYKTTVKTAGILQLAAWPTHKD